MRAVALLVAISSCGGPRGRVADPPPVQLPDLSTGSSGSGTASTGAQSLDIPRWPDLPADDGTSSASSSGAGLASSSTAEADASSAGSTTSSSSTSGSTGSGETGSTGSGLSTGPEPSGCPCEPGIDNFCDLAPKTAGCDATFPGGYCDPDGDGSYLDADFNAGFLAWKVECG